MATADASPSSPKDSPSPPPPSSAPASAAPSPARSPSPLPLPVPAPAPPSSRRLPPPCWTDDETLALIEAYRDKWFALRRGNLRASHWQEVADAVAGRCPHSQTPKTAVQCRHKVEKLRKRYRAERHRSLSHDPHRPVSSSWLYFHLLDSMEVAATGPTPASAAAAVVAGGGSGSTRRHSASPSPALPISDDDDDDDDDDNGNEGGKIRGGGGLARSVQRLRANGVAAGGGGATTGGLTFTIPRAVRSKIVGSRADDRPNPNPNPMTRFFKAYGGMRPGMEDMRRRLEKRRRRKEREAQDATGEMVAALRSLGDGFLRMEQMKMEMSREMEKVRMEMELKRTELILDSQRRIVDAFVKGFIGGGGRKRAKISPDS